MNRLELAIVDALKQGPASTLTIRERVAPRTGWWAKLWFAWSFLPSLWRLVDLGLLTVTKQSGGPERGYRDRYVYALIEVQR